MSLLRTLVVFGLLNLVHSDQSSNADLTKRLHEVVAASGTDTEPLAQLVLHLSDNLSQLTEKLKDNTRQIRHLEDRVEQLEEKVVEQDEEIHAKVREMKQMNDEHLQKVSENETNIAASAITRGNRQTPEIVAFSTVVSKHITHLGKNQPIKFDRILLNEGAGYDPLTGTFIAPTAGIYLFIYNFGHWSTSETWLQLMKNGVSQNGAAVEGSFPEQNLQGGNAAILDLNTGDHVWIETYQLADTTVQSFFTTFSGIMLY